MQQKLTNLVSWKAGGRQGAKVFSAKLLGAEKWLRPNTTFEGQNLSFFYFSCEIYHTFLIKYQTFSINILQNVHKMQHEIASGPSNIQNIFSKGRGTSPPLRPIPQDGGLKRSAPTPMSKSKQSFHCDDNLEGRVCFLFAPSFMPTKSTQMFFGSIILSHKQCDSISSELIQSLLFTGSLCHNVHFSLYIELTISNCQIYIAD